MRKITGEKLDKRYGKEPGVTYQNSTHKVRRNSGMDFRVFLSAKAKRRWYKNRRRRLAYKERHVHAPR
jgi:hypothetical protein